MASRDYPRSADEQWLHVSLEKVLGDICRDRRLKFLQGIGVAAAHFCRDLETDMQKLAQVLVVIGITGIVAKG